MKFLKHIRIAFTASILLVSNLLTAQTCPVISSITSGSAVCVGKGFTIEVNATSPDLSTLTYSWFKNGVVIPSQTSNKYVIPSFTTSDADTYIVKVGNSCGTLTSSSAVQLTASTAPTITSTFASPLSICEGQNYSTEVVANSNAGGPLSYQWKRNGVILPSATSAILNFTGLKTTDAGLYTIDVINSCGSTPSSTLQLDVLQKPIITLNPVGTTICVGALFNISADVTGATAYKWQKDGVDLGNSTKIFSVSTAIAANAGVYTFFAWNTCGSVTSSSATIVVNNTPVINSLVAPASVCAGTSATLVSNVSGNGDNNLTYTWSKGGTTIPGSNTPTLIVANFQSTNAGKYDLVVKNTCGPGTSASGAGLDKEIQLIQAPTIASEATRNVCLNSSVNVAPTLTNVTGGSIIYQWYFEGSAMSLQRSAQLNISDIKANQSGRYFLSVNNGCATASGIPFDINVLELPVIKTQPTASSDFCVGSIFDLQVVATDVQSFQWYKDDVAIPTAINADFSIPLLSVSYAGRYNVKVSNNCGYSVTSSNVILNVGSAPTVVPGPSIISACVGQPASVSVTANANGGGALQYAWTSSTGSIVDARNSTYSIASVAVTDAKLYTVAVSNRCGSINGGSFTLAIADKPTVAIATSMPNSATTGNPAVCIGSPITFTVDENSNGAPLTYTWYKDDVSKGVQSTNALTIASSASSDAGAYKLSVSNTCGNTLSNNIIVEVQDKPVFVLQPASITKCEQTTLNLSALAQNRSGTSSPINYNWYFNGNSLSSNNANLTLSNIAPTNTGNYRLEAGNMCGSIFSDVAAVTVISIPKYSIITPEKEFSICSAPSQIKTISLNVYAENSAPPNINWTTDFGSITGTTNTPTITIASVGKNATYFATMTNACGTVQLKDGQGVVVYNESALPSVTEYTMPPLTTFCERSPIKLNVATNSNGYETYIWKLNTTEVQTNQSGNPSSSDFQKIATATDGGTYTVDIKNSCGSVSNAVTIPVTINPTPNIDFIVGSQTTQCLAGNIFTFNNTSTNTTGGIRYAWDFGDGGKDISSILIASHTYTVSGNQVVKLTGVNDFGCTSSNTRNVVIAADPRITMQPIGKVVCEGDRYLLSATINDGGATSLSFQWYFNGQPISNNNDNSYAIVAMSASNAGSYYLKVMNSGCNLTAQSEPVNVSYQERPDVSFNVGGKSLKTCITAAEYTFTNTTPAVAGATYLWTFSDGTFLTGTNAVHQFLNTGIYDVSLTATAGGCGSTGYLDGNASNRITIDGIPVINKDLPSSTTVKKGNPIVLNINAGAVDANGAQMSLNYYWYKETSSSVIGTNSGTFNSITSALLSDSGRYYVTVNNVCGSAKSNTTFVKVHDIPSIILQPISTTACLGKTVQLKAEGLSNDNSTPLYQWFYRQDILATPLPIADATGPILNIQSFAKKDAGNYYVALSNSVGETISNSILVTADTLPVINYITSSSSLESGICVNTNLEINASVSSLGGGSYTISWAQNGIVVPDQFTPKLIFSSIKKFNAGSLVVNVTNACGSVSEGVNIKVIDIPQFNQSPSAATTCLNGAATFIAKLQPDTDGSPFGFQWLKDNRNFTGAGVITDEQLSLSNVQASDAGYYSLQSNNTCGINTSSTGRLTVVTTAPTITKQPSAINTCSGIQNAVTVMATSEDNILYYNWYKNGNLIANEIISQLSFNSISTADAGTYKVIVTNGCNLSNNSNDVQVVVKEKVSLNVLIADKQICVGDNLREDISGSLSGVDINTTFQWKLNGINLADASAGTSLTLLNITKSNDGLYSIDANNSCGASSLNLFKLTTASLPEITTQPVAGFSCAGGSFTNSVLVANAAQLPLSYQWLKDGNGVANNGISQQLLLQNIAVADQGLYAVRVSNSCGTTLSSSARLSLVGSPVIAQQPSGISTCSGLENTATVVASSDDNRLAYSWYKDGGLIAGQINSQLIFSKIGSGDGGTYKVVVTNGCNLSATSGNFQIVIKEKIVMNGSIADKALCVGSSLNTDISGFLTGTDVTSTYQWKLNGIDVLDPSAKERFLKLVSLTKTNDGLYSIDASNSCGTSSLNLFKLTTASLPEITTQPVAGFSCAGGSFTNSVLVANAAQLPLSYQWLKDGNGVANNGISQQLLLQNIAVADQGLYAVRVSNSCGTTLSSSARLSLVGSPVIAQQPLPINACVGEERNAIVLASSDDNRISYTWYKDGAQIPSQVGPQLIFAKIGSGDVGLYKAIVTNSCNLSSATGNFQVVIKEKISQTGSIADKQVCVGTDLQIDVSSTIKGADLSSSYQWRLNGVNISDASATTNTIKLLSVTKTNNGNYSVLATNSCGSTILDLFKLGVTNLPVIETQPLPGEVCENLDWSNKVVVSNLDQIGFTYQWFKDGVILPGANNPELYISKVNSSNQGLYSLRLSSACGNVMSNKELFQVRAKPEIGISLLGTAPTQCLESNAFVFKPNVLISDNSTVDLTWDFGDGVFSKQNQVSHSYQFANDFTAFLFAKSAYGCLDTAKQVISVNTKPIVIDNILNQIICAGGQLNYNVNVKLKPNEAVGYQWFFNQDPIANAVKSSFALDNVQLANNGLYKLRITNACGIAYSNESELKVAEKPLVTVPLPVNKKVCEGVSFTLKPTIFSLLPNTHQWYKNGLPYVGQENDSLLMKRFSNGDVANYSVTISNRCGTTTSKDGNLIMKNLPSSNQILTRDTICYQAGTVLKINDYLNNDDSLFFSWYKDGALIPSTSTSQYPIAKFNTNDAGSYSIGLTNSCGLLNVPIAKLTLNQIFANYRLDTADACKGLLSVNMLDTTRSFFPIVNNYWQVKEEKKVLTNLNSVNYKFINSGTYTIRHALMDAKGCVSDTISKSVINYGKPTAAFSINDTCMTMPSVALNSSIYGYGSSKIMRYTWNFGDTVIIRNTATVPGYVYKTPGTKKISLVVSSDSSCITDTLSKTLMVYGKPIASFSSQDSCQGFPVLFTNTSRTGYLPDSVVNFSWNFDDGTVVTSKNPQHIFKQYGSYKVKLTAYSSSCPFLFADTTVNFTVKIPRANMEYPRMQTVKKVFGQLDATAGGRSYSWFPYIGLSDSKIRNPRFNLNDDKVKYTITIVDSAGCVYNDKQEVWAFNKPDIYLSTGFSPNKDGVNDRFAPEYVEIKLLEYFRVADKHNRQVYITNKLTDKWDGSYKGNLLPPDPYLVTVSGIDIFGNKIVRQGIVILVK